MTPPQLSPACNACSFSLICLSGKRFYFPYYCEQCHAVWIEEIKTQVFCTSFDAYKEFEMLPGCPACEPFETDPKEITKVRGYQAQEKEETEESSRAANEE